MMSSKYFALFLFSVYFIHFGEAIKCYNCDSKATGQEHCGAYDSFDKNAHIPVDCTSDESPTPGTFCMKYVQQSPIGFVWDGRWRQVIRRCSSVAESGVTGVCNWGVEENGVYWEECYCSEDGCNSATSLLLSPILVLGLIVAWTTFCF